MEFLGRGNRCAQQSRQARLGLLYSVEVIINPISLCLL